MLVMVVALAASLELEGQGVPSFSRVNRKTTRSLRYRHGIPEKGIWGGGVALVSSPDPRPQGREELKSFLALACSASIADSFSHFVLSAEPCN